MSKKPKPKSLGVEPPRLKAKVLSRLLDGEAVELPNQGWRKKGFYDLKTEKKTLRIFCVEVKGDKALVRLASEEKVRYPKASYSQSNYTNVPALGLRGAGPAVPPDVQKAQSDEARERDAFLRAQIPLHEELKAIEGKLRPQQRAELRRRIEGFKRSAHEKAA